MKNPTRNARARPSNAIAAPGGSVQSIAIFLEQVMPRLVELGLFRSKYRHETFMEHLQQTND